MKFLITTQAVDLDDPVLAFFHGWIEEFAKHAEHVHVICLKEGRHALPSNVTVHSLGKEAGASRIKYVSRFLRYAWKLRSEYDTVFVHMNPEYLVLTGWLWRLLRKKTVLWYIHPKSSWRLRTARLFANTIVSASKQSFPLSSWKLVPVGHGIDTDFFSPGEASESNTLRVMLAARLAPVKHVECVVSAITQLSEKGTPVSFDYYGGELERDKEYADAMREFVRTALPAGVWTWKGDSPKEIVRDAYRAHDVHVNATDSGSFDKAVFESMASGCITIVSNTALKGIVPDALIFAEGDSKSLAEKLLRIQEMPRSERQALKERMREIAVKNYSLPALIGKLAGILNA